MTMALRRMKCTEITVHGFRSSFRTWAGEQTSFPREIAESALSHGNEDKVEAAYLRTEFLMKRRDLMQQWSAFLTSASPKSATLTVLKQSDQE
jgi:integrase